LAAGNLLFASISNYSFVSNISHSGVPYPIKLPLAASKRRGFGLLRRAQPHPRGYLVHYYIA
jgi:hypothetical protein